MTEKNQIFDIIDGALTGKELLDQPRAFLLLRLCQFCLSFDPERAEKYWLMLSGQSRALPQENQAELTELRTNFEEAVSTEKKGFAAEMLAEIAEIKKLESDEEKKTKLKDCEARLKKRFNPLGKGPVWKALVEVWLPLDHPYAFQLMKNISGRLQNDILKRLNRAALLEPNEWTLLSQTLGAGKIESLILEILADENQTIRLEEPLIEQVAKKIRAGLPQLSMPLNTELLTKNMHNHARLLALHAAKDKENLLGRLIAEMVEDLAKASWLDPVWLERFNLIQSILNTGAQLESQGLSILTPSFADTIVNKLPPYLQKFFLATRAGLSAKADAIPAAYQDLMARTSNDEISEAWFFVILVQRGFCKEAMQEAQKSPRADTLLPRLRRAWICSNPTTACTVIKPSDMAGDAIGEFLAMGTSEKRAEHLKNSTDNGKHGVPGAMWAGVGTEDNSEGVRGFWASLTAHQKTFDEIIQEYLTLNPLYSSYTRNTPKEQQFDVHLAVNGFGRYTYQEIDSALLGALVAWAEKEQAPVYSVLQAMWNAIRPDDNILRVDWLRNAILSRCVTVFGADQNVLFNDYLNWLQVELVQKGRQWQIGKQIITLRYPPTSPLQFSLISASAISAFSTNRRDQIIIGALQKYEGNPQLIENAAMLYNGGKTIMDLTPPTTIKQNFLPNWQTGIVKNALPSILQVLILGKVNPT
ncbi:MAG TPA: hypothetical protein PLL88_11185 [Anaerolineaceae bacterium]|nr:hypothetical protein [Anaerolineaceae bacterium]